MEDRKAIELNIERYRALQRRELPRGIRAMLAQLLADEIAKLARVASSEETGRREPADFAA